MNETILIQRVEIGLTGRHLYRVTCNNIGLFVPAWRITEALIMRVIRMSREQQGVGL